MFRSGALAGGLAVDFVGSRVGVLQRSARWILPRVARAVGVAT